MKRNHVLLSVGVFSVFSLLGPLMQRVSLRAFLAVHSEHLTLLFCPAALLAAGGHPGDPHDLWMSVTVNVFLFAILGLIVGAVGRRTWVVVSIYVCLCALMMLVEAWGSGFSLAYFSWSILVFACLLYLLPFCAFIWSRSIQMNKP